MFTFFCSFVIITDSGGVKPVKRIFSRIVGAYKKKPIKYTVLICFAILLISLTLWTIWSNTALQCNTYTVSSSRLPQAFDSFRIAQISDLHNDVFGNDNEDLLQILKDAQPDMIAITGDMIDSYDTNTDVALRFAKEAVKIAPCYYVTGNHEARVPHWKQFLADLVGVGVHVLYDDLAVIEIDGQKIAVLGINDPNFQTYESVKDQIIAMSAQDEYTVLLSHRPELLSEYASSGVDLVLSGHAHGGQFRLPFVGGMIAPNQGLFPEYDAGSFQKGSTTMIVSRGLGNSAFPFRFNNRPEVVIVELKAE